MTKMDLDAFREITLNPVAWRAKALTLRSAADWLWESLPAFFATNPGALGDSEIADTVARRFVERLHTAQLLYGLATETALKGRIISLDPAAVEFTEKQNGDGVLVDLKLKRIGTGLQGDGHDLVALAKAAGLIGDGANAVFSVESDRTTIAEILAFLTECVRWSGRYPAPKTVAGYYQPMGAIPSRVLGLYMRDWLDRFLDVALDISVK
jgi:hypothetical protein